MFGGWKFLAFSILIVSALLLSGCVQQTETTTTPPSGTTTTTPETSGTIVKITPSGFNPSAITISKGTTVSFQNDDSALHWPASAPHPEHTDYPEFDAKKAIAPGEIWSFTFEKAGDWKFHDHLNCCSNPKWFGSVVVQ